MMTLKQIWEPGLAHWSYLVGADNREAAVIDPNRDIDRYLSLAVASGLRIVAILETHIHADYASGAYELAKRTGARVYVSDEGPDDWKYSFKDEDHVRPVYNGDRISISNLEFEVVATPGHRPEHVAFVLTDTVATSEPLAVFSGDFLFVGDIGRPDLLERAAGFAGTMEAGAKVLFRSIQEFSGRFEDQLLIFPAHGAGSSCGKKLGDVPTSTLGYEKLTNWALKTPTEQEFVSEVLQGQPEPPAYFKEMKRINKILPEPRSSSTNRVTGDGLLELVKGGAKLIDVRSSGEYAAGFIPGSINIPMGPEFLNWAGSLISYAESTVLLVSNAADATNAEAAMKLIGMNAPVGWCGTEALRAYERHHKTLPLLTQVDPQTVLEGIENGGMDSLDVRTSTEFANGHIPGAHSIPLNVLKSNLADVPRDKPVVVYCAGGTRSPIAVSIIQQAGIDNAILMPAGFADWKALGQPVESKTPTLV